MSFDTFNDYANYSSVVSMSYRIIEKLFENDTLWKLIKYNETDVLSPTYPNLTDEEKKSLIYSGEDDSEPFRVFQQPFMDDADTRQQTQLRVYPMVTDPTKRTVAHVDIAFEVLTHVKINTLTNNTTRVDNMQYQILKTLNGVEIDGLNPLFFDKNGRFSNSLKLKITNNNNYLGFIMIMSTSVG